MKEQIIFEDFIQDREVRMYDKHFSDTDNKVEYDVYVQVFTMDNLPFSSVTGKLDNIPFNYDNAGTKEVVVNNVIGDYFNPVTKKNTKYPIILLLWGTLRIVILIKISRLSKCNKQL